ncbi:MAG: hypothetical protein L3J41_13725 [Melioribacteraceae bacterium]|nr:hypothetical protein [Melioribacteraceae bacterium]
MKRIILTLILFLCSSTLIFAQASNTVSSITFGEITDGNPVDVKVSLINSLSVSRVQIVYKSFQETEVRVREMEILGDIAVYQIAGEDVSAPILTYYLIIEMKDGNSETYPLGVPEAAQPIDLTVSSKSEKDEEVLILSPSSNETLSLSELFISISMVKASDNVDISKTKIILNGEDVTSNVLFAGELLLYYPQNFEGSLESGKQSLEIEVYDKDGTLYHTMKRDFVTVDGAVAMDLGRGLRYSGNAAGEVRNELFNGKNTLYNNLALTLNARVGDWRFKGYGYITSEENVDVQPQNRYSVSVSSDWLNLRGGDSYPRYNNLLLNGKRVRGVDGKIDYGVFQLQGSYGQVRREVKGNLLETYAEDDAPLLTNVVRIDSIKYGSPFGKVDFGIYSRDLLSGRIGLGSKNGFEFGVSFLHAKDDVNSVEFGAKPEENLVTSADLRWAIDDQNIIIKGITAVSIINSDITSGTYSDEQIDSIFASGNDIGSDAENFKNIKNMISPFFTVNQFIEPLNFTELSSLAAEGSIELNYFNNNLKGSYIYRGSQFKSFGQEYTRTDIAGLNITDRFRTLDNQLFFSVGYENLNDNLQGTKMATTTYQTLRASASLFMRADIPNITLSYIRNQNRNGIELTDTLNRISSVDDITNRFSLNFGYDFKFSVRHNSSLSFSTSNREDDSYYNNDSKYFSTSFTLNSYWTKTLVSNFSVIYYNSEITTVQYKYVTIMAGGRYRLMNDDLELSFNYSPSFGDFNRHAVDLVASYQVIQNLWLRAQMRYYNMPDTGTNTISGMTLRYSF